MAFVLKIMFGYLFLHLLDNCVNQAGHKQSVLILQVRQSNYSCIKRYGFGNLLAVLMLHLYCLGGIKI